MGRKSQRKGYRTEHELVEKHREIGVDAYRVPLSGGAGRRSGSGETADLVVAGNLRAEVKSRGGGQGFLTLERWLGDHDLLFLRRDRKKPLVVVSWKTYARMIAALARSSNDASEKLR